MNQIDIENLYKLIRKDITSNLEDVFNLRKVYSRKYRGDEWNDVNVGISDEEEVEKRIQIFLRNNSGSIKEVITVDGDSYEGELITTFPKLKEEYDENK